MSHQWETHSRTSKNCTMMWTFLSSLTRIFGRPLRKPRAMENLKISLKELFGDTGVGSQIPLPVQTFCFDEKAVDDQLSFRWSSAITVGWIEEDIDWYYQRFFDNQLEGARQWYEFPKYSQFSKRMEELRSDKTEVGARHRKFFGYLGETPKVDAPATAVRTYVPPHRSSFDVMSDILDDEISTPQSMLVTKEFFKAMSDLVPGMGQVFEHRLYKMLQQSAMGV